MYRKLKTSIIVVGALGAISLFSAAQQPANTAYTLTALTDSALINNFNLKAKQLNDSLSYAEIKEAAIVRLRPILITDINSLFGLLPLALVMGDGTEMLQPMAIVVIGGLLFGLLLVFIFIPVVYAILYGYKQKKQVQPIIN